MRKLSQVVAFDWPLLTSGANALHAFLEEGARDVAAKTTGKLDPNLDPTIDIAPGVN
jgi:hypothetical protein